MRTRQGTVCLVIMGFIMFMAAYFSAKLPQLALFWGSGSTTQRIVYTRAEHPQMFILITAALAVVGLLLLASAFYSYFRFRKDAEPDEDSETPGKARVWQVMNTLSMIASLYAGWAALQPDVLRRTNPDAILCGIVFVVMLLFPLGAMSYSIFAAKQETLRRPSWSRWSLDWWHDPLQCLLLSTCFVGGMSIGAVFHLKDTTGTAFWTFMTFCSMFTGLVIGQLFVYAAFRDRIVDA